MAVNPEIKRVLERKKEWYKNRGKEFELRKPRIREPKQLERQYRNSLVERQETLIELTERFLIEKLATLLSNNNQSLPTRDDSTFHQDALADDLFVIINQIRVQFGQIIPEREVRNTARSAADQIAQHNAQQMDKVVKSTLDLDLFRSEPWLRGQVENFIEQNVALIKSVDERYFSEIQENVFRGARQGKSTKEIAEGIRQRSGVSKSRAELIARDQVNKFNGQLTQIRQTELGVKKYRWRTSEDERVRPQHSARNGRVYSWDDPPSDGHPGEPIQCRCYAEPVLEDLV